MAQWEQFGVRRSRDWVPIDGVRHTTHIDSAIAIVRDGQIRPSPVAGASILNAQRVLVSWLSPNYEQLGFRFGNVSFLFDFENVIEGRNFYFVEKVPYERPTFRFLITDIYRDLQIERYDPAVGNGPWQFDEVEGKHYRRDDHVLHFMLEDSLDLMMCKSLEFVKHNHDQCALHNSNPKECAEIGFSDLEAAARFLTRAAVTGSSLLRLLDPEKSLVERGISRFSLDAIPRGKDPCGEIAANSPLAVPLARATMSAYTYGRVDEAELLAAQFKTIEEFAHATAKIAAEITGIELDPSQLIR